MRGGRSKMVHISYCECDYRDSHKNADSTCNDEESFHVQRQNSDDQLSQRL